MVFRANQEVAQTPDQQKDQSVLTVLLIHLSPEHFRITAGLAQDVWWNETKKNIDEYLRGESLDTLLDDKIEARISNLPGPMKQWIRNAIAEQRGQLPSISGGGSAVSQGPTLNFQQIEKFAQDNMEVLLDALSELKKDTGSGVWGKRVIVRFGHATHATKEIVEKMGELGVHSEQPCFHPHHFSNITISLFFLLF